MLGNVRFRVFDSQSIRNYASAEITSTELFDKKGTPKPGGVFDSRLGTVSRTYNCRTCRHDIRRCPGHFGYLDLAVPIYNPVYVKFLVKCLQCVCVHCRRTVSDQRCGTFASFHAACRSLRVCGRCKMPIEAKYTISRTDKLPLLDGEEFRPSEAYMRLSRVPDEDVPLFRTTVHPKHFILKAFPIPPPHAHPPITGGGGKVMYDDFTMRLVDIVRTNKAVQEQPEKRKEHASTLQMHVSSIIDNGTVAMHARHSRPFKGLAQRIKGKEGRIRGNLSGKRVDFSARSVITGDPGLDLDQLGVPRQIANTLTIPETVTAVNCGFLERAVKKGGAKSVVRKNGRMVDVRINNKVRLQIGDVVERYLRDGDLVIFNRQPTLHRMSMMVHRVVVMEGKTFRMNVAATTPYNADFDGDEMNVHCPQTIEAQAELREIMALPNYIVSSQANRPVIGLVQDGILGIHVLTLDTTWLPRHVAMNLWVAGKMTDPFPPPCAPGTPPRWSGKAIVSGTLPNITCTLANGVVVDRGVLVSGTLTKRSVGGNGGLVHRIWLAMGPDACADWITRIQFVAHAFLLYRGFSVGADDMAFGIQRRPEIHERIQNVVDEVCDSTVRAYRAGLAKADIESSVLGKLDFARDRAGTYARDRIDAFNRLRLMVESGSKGSNINISQIVACVGQQHVGGGRPEPTFDGSRCLPHFAFGDPDPRAYGFVQASYMHGLSPTDFFFHAQAGREGVVDTAVRTSETGYIQRKYAKNLEDIHVVYDGTVRDFHGYIYQFAFGGCGYDPTRLMMQRYHGESYLLPFIVEEVLREDADVQAETGDVHVADTVSRFFEHARNVESEATFRRMERNARCEIERAMVPPGENVGIIAAQSLGEVSTQLTLDSFHRSGAGGSITAGGVPRLRELINLTKDTNTEIVAPLCEGVDGSSLLARHNTVPIQRFFASFDTVICTDDMRAWDPFPPEDVTGHVIEMRVHRSRMVSAGYDIADLCAVIVRDMEHVHVWGTDLNAPEAAVYASLPHAQFAVLFKSELDTLVIRKGEGGIDKCRLGEEGTGAVVFENATLENVLAVVGLDHANVVTNSVLEAYEMFGVEASREVFLREMKRVFTDAGSYLNPYNYEILADVMFQSGTPMPVNRYGLRTHKGVLGRASFETSVDILTTAAVKGETDHLLGVSERLVTGTRIATGTGMMQILPNEKHMARLHRERTKAEGGAREVVAFAPSSPGRDWSAMETSEIPLELDDDDEEVGEETSWVPGASDEEMEESSWLPMDVDT